MKLASDTLRIVTHEDAELAKKPPVRAGELIPDADPDPDKLMDLLGDIDSLKLEIHERMRRIEAVKQAKSVLLEDAMRTEALNRRLGEIGKVMSAVHSGLPIPEPEHYDPAALRIATKTMVPEVQVQTVSSIPENEVLALPWQIAEELVGQDTNAANLTASSDGFEEAQGTVEAMMAYRMASEQLEKTEESRKLADENALEAKRLLDESTQRMEEATRREQQLAADFQAAQEALTASCQAASERLAEAELRWKQTDQAAADAQRLLNQSAAELEQVRAREEAIESSLQAFRQQFSTAYQSASQRLDEAQQFWQKGDEAAQLAQRLIDQTTAELLQARNAEETAAAELVSARQELTTAYQFAAVAAQRRLDAVEFFQKATRWMVFGTAISWSGMAWIAWLSFRTMVPIWGPAVVTIAIVVLSIVVRNLGIRKSDGG